MDLKSMRCFLAVAETLSFSRAAEMLFITQPSLSVRVQGLEQELNTTLFRRSNKGVYLTDAGFAILPIVRHILQEADRLPSAAAAAAELHSEATELHLGIDATEDREDVPPLVNTLQFLQKRSPHLHLSVTQTTFETYEDELRSGTLDAAIVVLCEDDSPPADLLSLPLFREKIKLVATNTGVASANEIFFTHEFLFLQSDLDSRWTRRYIRFIHSKNPDARLKIVDNITPLNGRLELAYGNTAIFFPETYADSLSGKRISVFPSDIPRSDVILSLLWHRDASNPAIQLLVNAARNATAGRSTDGGK